MKIDQVIDYDAKDMAKKPQRLHRRDCIHPEDEHAVFRDATEEELRTLPMSRAVRMLSNGRRPASRKCGDGR